MKYLRALFLLAMALPCPARAASTLYAATSLGPFKSTDSGVTWNQLAQVRHGVGSFGVFRHSVRGICFHCSAEAREVDVV